MAHDRHTKEITITWKRSFRLNLNNKNSDKYIGKHSTNTIFVAFQTTKMRFVYCIIDKNMIYIII